MSGKQTTSGRGTNLGRMGGFNESVVLAAIRHAMGGLSRVEIAHATGLSAQTASNICRRLLERDMVVETGTSSVSVGRPRQVLEINPRGAYALGLHLDPAVVTYAVLDLTGNVVCAVTKPTPPSAQPQETIAAMAKSLALVVEQSGVPSERVLGLGVAAPGPIDAATGELVSPPQLSGWGRASLREELAKATPWDVTIAKDVVAVAVAECWAGVASQIASCVIFYLGTGAGMGLIADGQVVRGVSGNAGEIGGLDASVTTSALVAEAIERGVLSKGSAPSGPAAAGEQVEQLARLAHEGDVVACDILDGWGTRVGHAVCTAASLLDAEMIIFSGPMWPHLRERFMAVVPPVIAQWPYPSVHAVSLAESTLGENAGAIGAGCLVLDRVLSPQPQSLLLA